MRVAIIGCGGQLGRELVARIDPADAIPLTHKQIEITDRASIAKILDKHEPRCVINAAAYNFVDRAEDEPDAAWKVNSIGPRQL